MPQGSNPAPEGDRFRPGAENTRNLLVSLEQLRNHLSDRVDQLGQAMQRLRTQAGELERSLEEEARVEDALAALPHQSVPAGQIVPASRREREQTDQARPSAGHSRPDRYPDLIPRRSASPAPRGLSSSIQAEIAGLSRPITTEEIAALLDRAARPAAMPSPSSSSSPPQSPLGLRSFSIPATAASTSSVAATASSGDSGTSPVGVDGDANQRTVEERVADLRRTVVSIRERTQEALQRQSSPPRSQTSRFQEASAAAARHFRLEGLTAEEIEVLRAYEADLRNISIDEPEEESTVVNPLPPRRTRRAHSHPAETSGPNVAVPRLDLPSHQIPLPTNRRAARGAPAPIVVRSEVTQGQGSPMSVPEEEPVPRASNSETSRGEAERRESDLDPRARVDSSTESPGSPPGVSGIPTFAFDWSGPTSQRAGENRQDIARVIPSSRPPAGLGSHGAVSPWRRSGALWVHQNRASMEDAQVSHADDHIEVVVRSQSPDGTPNVFTFRANLEPNGDLSQRNEPATSNSSREVDRAISFNVGSTSPITRDLTSQAITTRGMRVEARMNGQIPDTAGGSRHIQRPLLDIHREREALTSRLRAARTTEASLTRALARLGLPSSDQERTMTSPSGMTEMEGRRHGPSSSAATVSSEDARAVGVERQRRLQNQRAREEVATGSVTQIRCPEGLPPRTQRWFRGLTTSRQREIMQLATASGDKTCTGTAFSASSGKDISTGASSRAAPDTNAQAEGKVHDTEKRSTATAGMLVNDRMDLDSLIDMTLTARHEHYISVAAL